ncbi:restriction endonuclease subunit S [Leptolyngbya boryana CZ1]|uniref:Restriction endonuclease subunit S n=1 Tax=Leptolyngbya boryana CZ1 TaxID=3060204 RepID=A0AA96X0F7_LEPBY|nr:restriction endonuclease subunit S [Leptolyngbya boryana]WNZ47524.1 restriction endonuclease subunit S [Leptolyngbya boryana CZ1]
MSIEIFLKQFELLTGAPNSATQLREIILQLAVSGKLVPQNIDDEPAAILLAKIKVEKEQLIRNSRNSRSKSKNLGIEKNFVSLPKTWEWASLEDTTLVITDGEHATPSRIMEAEIPLGTAKNIRDGFLDFKITDYVSFEVAEKCWRRCKPQHNDILMVCVGATTGRLCLLKEPPNFVIVRSVALIRPFENYIFPEYVALAMKSPLIQRQVWGNVKQSAQPCLYINKMQKLHIPVPPLAEQKRIVEKCDRLLILCNEIEKRQQQRQESLLNMNESAIAQLINAQNRDDFQHHWQLICNNFDLLYSIPETIPRLRQSILQLAVQGKLIPQDPNDEPASQMLKYIRKERCDRETNLKVKNQIATEADIVGPSEIPNSWVWATTSQVCYLILDGDHNPPKRVSTGIPHLTAKNIINNRIELNGCTYISEEDFQRVSRRYFPEAGDVILTCVGSLGRTAIVPKNLVFSADRNLAVLRPVNKFILSEYIQLVLNSPEMQRYIASADGKTAQPHIYLKQIRALLCPLPPLAEQKRIVAKVNSLLSLCDALEAKLKAVRDSSTLLMEVTARQVLVI